MILVRQSICWGESKVSHHFTVVRDCAQFQEIIFSHYLSFNDVGYIMNCHEAKEQADPVDHKNHWVYVKVCETPHRFSRSCPIRPRGLFFTTRRGHRTWEASVGQHRRMEMIHMHQLDVGKPTHRWKNLELYVSARVADLCRFGPWYRKLLQSDASVFIFHHFGEWLHFLVLNLS